MTLSCFGKFSCLLHFSTALICAVVFSAGAAAQKAVVSLSGKIVAQYDLLEATIRFGGKPAV